MKPSKTSYVKPMLEEMIKAKGFKKRKGSTTTWIKDLPDVYQVMTIQKSFNGDYFFLNLGVTLRNLDDTVPKNSAFCHIERRANEGLRGGNKGRFHDMLDETRPTPNEERRCFVQETFDGHISDFFKSFETEQQMLEFALTPKDELAAGSPQRRGVLVKYAKAELQESNLA